LFLEDKTREPIRLETNAGRVAISGGPLIVPVSATTFRPNRPSMFFRSGDDFVLTFVDADHIEAAVVEALADHAAHRRRSHVEPDDITLSPRHHPPDPF